jgi:tryptophan synthase alpha subunit
VGSALVRMLEHAGNQPLEKVAEEIGALVQSLVEALTV